MSSEFFMSCGHDYFNSESAIGIYTKDKLEVLDDYLIFHAVKFTSGNKFDVFGDGHEKRYIVDHLQTHQIWYHW